MTTPVVTPADFNTVWDSELTFPFIEDQSGIGVYGYGHTDKAEFASSVNEYDRLAGGADDGYTADEVQHIYGVPSAASPTRFAWRRITPDMSDAFPLTIIDRPLVAEWRAGHW